MNRKDIFRYNGDWELEHYIGTTTNAKLVSISIKPLYKSSTYTKEATIIWKLNKDYK